MIIKNAEIVTLIYKISEGYYIVQKKPYGILRRARSVPLERLGE